MRTSLPAVSPLIAALVLGVMACDEQRDTGWAPTSPSALSKSGPPADFDLFFEAVEFRPGASADIHVKVFVHESKPCRDPLRTALFIHGVNATAASWGRLADAFLDGASGEPLCLIAAIDHPGHGRSGLPTGVLFGELMIEDYARTVIQVLERLRREGIRPAILLGHSQGTSTIQTMQQMLALEGTDLRTRFGIRDAVLLGVQGPREVRAGFLLPPDVVAGTIASLITTTPEKGTFVHGPPEIFQQLWFVNLELSLSAASPSLETISANGWNEDVPLFAALQAAGQNGFDTPSVPAGVFGPESGTALHLIDFADDPWSLTPQARDIYRYLTGDPTLRRFVSLTDPDHEAVHDYMITHAEVVRSAILLPRGKGRRSAAKR